LLFLIFVAILVLVPTQIPRGAGRCTHAAAAAIKQSVAAPRAHWTAIDIAFPRAF